MSTTLSLPARERLARYGTHAMLDMTHSDGSLPTRSERDVTFEGPNGTLNLITYKACFVCTFASGRIASIDPDHLSVKGRPQRQTASGRLEYESVFALGAMAGVDDIDAVTFADFLCNEHGMDTITFGGALAAAMELFETGVVTMHERQASISRSGQPRDSSPWSWPALGEKESGPTSGLEQQGCETGTRDRSSR